MKDISFDNPYLLFIAIPLLLVIVLPFFIIGNKDNKSLSWKLSIVLHVVVIALVTLAAAGLKATSVLTETTVYVVADVSYSSNENLDKIDGYIEEIEDNLPQNSKLGVVCFGKNVILLTPAGRDLKSVTEAKVDNTATDIAGALTYTESLFKGDTLKRIVLITDGNDTVNESASSIAAVVARLKESDIKVDTIFLDNDVAGGDTEVQLSNVEYADSTYLGHESSAKIFVQSSKETNVVVELYAREQAQEGETAEEFEKIDYTVLLAEEGLNSVTMPLRSGASGVFEYKVVAIADGDISAYNNARTFTQEIVGKTKILLVTGKAEDKNVIDVTYGDEAEIDAYVIAGGSGYAPVTLEEILEYDEIVVSNLDIRNIKNVNAFIDSVDMAVSQYGKSLITFGDLRLQTDSEDAVFKKFRELLPVNYGNSSREGRLYTLVLDVSDSMFMASKFTTAKEAAIKLLSVLGDDDYVCLVTFSGEIKVQTPKKAAHCRQDLIAYIDSLSTDHGTDLGLGLEEALKTVKALKMEENQIMIISDGFSFDSERSAIDVAKELYDTGTVISAINTYFPAGGAGGGATLRSVVNAGKGGKYYEITKPEDVEKVVFGSVADDIGDVIIEEDSRVNVVKYNDTIMQGFSEIPTVSGYIISMEKYDATVPLTVNHLKPGGYTETVPLYAYRAHGNGRIASFTSNLSGEWTKYWSAADKDLFVGNMFLGNTPKSRQEVPFTVKIERNEKEAYIEIVPSVLNPKANTTIKITLPNGRTMTRELTFDSRKYFYTWETVGVGTYSVQITYTYDDKKFEKTETFHIPYLAEYNAFVGCDTSKIYQFMRDSEAIYESEIPNLENDKNEVTTYQVSYRIPLLIASASVFVADILIRKLALGKKKKTVKR